MKNKRKLIYYFTTLCLSLLMGGQIFAQNLELSGKVVDAATDEPLPGVTIIVKGTTTGTSTDVAGNFTLSVPEGTTLVITSIGYNPVEQLVENDQFLTIRLEISVEQLDEVIVIGYGTVKKEDATGSVAVVDAEDFNVGNNNKPQDLIVGKMPGVVVTPSDGAPTSAAQARRIGASVPTGSRRKRRATLRTRLRCASTVRYSTGDLPSTRARNRPGSRLAVRASSPWRGSHVTPAR